MRGFWSNFFNFSVNPYSYWDLQRNNLSALPYGEYLEICKDTEFAIPMEMYFRPIFPKGYYEAERIDPNQYWVNPETLKDPDCPDIMVDGVGYHIYNQLQTAWFTEDTFFSYLQFKEQRVWTWDTSSGRYCKKSNFNTFDYEYAKKMLSTDIHLIGPYDKVTIPKNFPNLFIDKSFYQVRKDPNTNLFLRSSPIRKNPELLASIRKNRLLTEHEKYFFSTNSSHTPPNLEHCFSDQQAIRRFINPTSVRDFNPAERFLFKAEPHYRRFVNVKPLRPKAPGTHRGVDIDQAYPQNPSQIYFFIADPSNSFKSEYDLRFAKTSINQLYESSRLDQSIKRHLPFKSRHYDFTERDNSGDPIFNSPHKIPFSRHRIDLHSIPRRPANTPLRPKNFDADYKLPMYGDTNLFVFWVKDLGSTFFAYINKVVIQPVTTLFSEAFLYDTLLGDYIISIFFFFYDYVFVVIQLYFPFFWVFFDYNFSTYKLMPFSQLFYLVSTFFLIFLVNHFIFKKIFEQGLLVEFPSFWVTCSFFIYATFTDFSFFLSLFFLLAILFWPFSFFKSYDYPATFIFFLPGASPHQLLGFYKTNYFFQIWPTRFTVSKLFSAKLFNIFKEKKTNSFFFFKNIKRRPFITSVNTSINGLSPLSAPFFGPSIMPQYEYNSELVENNHLSIFETALDSIEGGFVDVRKPEIDELSYKFRYQSFEDEKNIPFDLVAYEYTLDSKRSDSEDSSLSSTGLWGTLSLLTSSKFILPYYPFRELRHPYQRLFKQMTLAGFLYALSPTKFIYSAIVNKFYGLSNFSAKTKKSGLVFFILDIFFFIITSILLILRLPFSFFKLLTQEKLSGASWFFSYFKFIFFALFTQNDQSRLASISLRLYFNYRKIYRRDLQLPTFKAFLFHFLIWFFLFLSRSFYSLSSSKMLFYQHKSSNFLVRLERFAFSFSILKLLL